MSRVKVPLLRVPRNGAGWPRGSSPPGNCRWQSLHPSGTQMTCHGPLRWLASACGFDPLAGPGFQERIWSLSVELVKLKCGARRSAERLIQKLGSWLAVSEKLKNESGAPAWRAWLLGAPCIVPVPIIFTARREFSSPNPLCTGSPWHRCSFLSTCITREWCVLSALKNRCSWCPQAQRIWNSTTCSGSHQAQWNRKWTWLRGSCGSNRRPNCAQVELLLVLAFVSNASKLGSVPRAGAGFPDKICNLSVGCHLGCSDFKARPGERRGERSRNSGSGSQSLYKWEMSVARLLEEHVRWVCRVMKEGRRCRDPLIWERRALRAWSDPRCSNAIPAVVFVLIRGCLEGGGREEGPCAGSPLCDCWEGGGHQVDVLLARTPSRRPRLEGMKDLRWGPHWFISHREMGAAENASEKMPRTKKKHQRPSAIWVTQWGTSKRRWTERSLSSQTLGTLFSDEAHQHTRHPHHQRHQKHDRQEHENYTSVFVKARCKCGKRHNLSMRATPIVTRAASLEPKKNAQTSTAVNEGIGPTNGLCKTCEFSGVVAARLGAKERRWSGITHDWATRDSNNIFRRANRDTPTSHFCAVNSALEAAICEKSPAGRFKTSQSCGNPTSR